MSALPGMVTPALLKILETPIDLLRQKPLTPAQQYEIYLYVRDAYVHEPSSRGIPGVLTLDSGFPGNTLTLSGGLHSNEPCFTGAMAMALAMVHQGHVLGGRIKLIVNNLEGLEKYWHSYIQTSEPMSERSGHRFVHYNMNRIPYLLGDVADAYWAFRNAYPGQYATVEEAAARDAGVWQALQRLYAFERRMLDENPIPGFEGRMRYETQRLLELMPAYYEDVPQGREQLVIDYHSMSAPGTPMLLSSDSVVTGPKMIFSKVKGCASLLLSNFAQLTAQATGLALYAHIMSKSADTMTVAIECGQHEDMKNTSMPSVLVAAESAYDTMAALGLTLFARANAATRVRIWEAVELLFPPVKDGSYRFTELFPNGRILEEGTVYGTSHNPAHPPMVAHKRMGMIFATTPEKPMPTAESAATLVDVYEGIRNRRGELEVVGLAR
ncbi:MAG: hypothetical protein J0L97_10185 [Alphaproteobacteria bacterium]|nr:hypothetical protein [Alphaproteobacteria bacterium]